jgi:DNA-binding response OmpR family regulator
MTKKEFMILEYLLRHKGQLISRNQLLEHAWDMNVDIFSNIVDTHIKNLRKKLGHNGRLISTIYGSGYRISGEDSD